MRFVKNTCFLLLSFFISLQSYSRPSFEGTDMRTKNFHKVQIKKNENLVLYFLNSNCPCSQAHFDHLNQLQKQYPQFTFIGFHSQKNVSIERAQKSFGKHKIDFPILMDKSLKFANFYKAVKTPHVFVVNNKDEILFQGGATNSRNPKRASKFYLQEALKALALGEEVPVKNAKTIGCYIKR
jgi:peroxiredoxin